MKKLISVEKDKSNLGLTKVRPADHMWTPGTFHRQSPPIWFQVVLYMASQSRDYASVSEWCRFAIP